MRYDLIRELLDVLVNSKYFLDMDDEYQAQLIQHWQKLSMLIDAVIEFHYQGLTEEAKGISEFYNNSK